MPKVIKSCFVPKCSNDSKLNPDKIFVTVPQNEVIRKRWFDVIQCTIFTRTGNLFCCEDHFDLQEDSENWMYFKTIGTRLVLKKDVVPHKNICQIDTDTTKNLQISTPEKKRKQEVLDAFNSSEESQKKQKMLLETQLEQHARKPGLPPILPKMPGLSIIEQKSSKPSTSRITLPRKIAPRIEPLKIAPRLVEPLKVEPLVIAPRQSDPIKIAPKLIEPVTILTTACKPPVVINLSDKCFMCFNSSSDLVNIFQEDLENNPLSQIIYLLPELNIQKSHIPMQVCPSCKSLLESFYKFKKMCLENFNRWTLYTKNIIKSTTQLNSTVLPQNNINDVQIVTNHSAINSGVVIKQENDIMIEDHVMENAIFLPEHFRLHENRSKTTYLFPSQTQIQNVVNVVQTTVSTPEEQDHNYITQDMEQIDIKEEFIVPDSVNDEEDEFEQKYVIQPTEQNSWVDQKTWTEEKKVKKCRKQNLE